MVVARPADWSRIRREARRGHADGDAGRGVDRARAGGGGAGDGGVPCLRRPPEPGGVRGDDGARPPVQAPDGALCLRAAAGILPRLHPPPLPHRRHGTRSPIHGSTTYFYSAAIICIYGGPEDPDFRRKGMKILPCSMMSLGVLLSDRDSWACFGGPCLSVSNEFGLGRNMLAWNQTHRRDPAWVVWPFYWLVWA